MIVICEECGKKYRIDPAKIPTKGAKFKCKTCSHVIAVAKPEESASEAPQPPPAQVDTQAGEEKPIAAEPEKRREAPSIKAAERFKRKPKGLGLRTKMAFLFVFIPILFIAAAGVLYLWQLDTWRQTYSA
jgi:hypothetical protein